MSKIYAATVGFILVFLLVTLVYLKVSNFTLDKRYTGFILLYYFLYVCVVVYIEYTTHST